MAVSRITTPAIANLAITQAKIASSVDLGGAVKIANVQVANSSWSLLDDTAVDTDGGYVLVNGTNFVSGCNVLVGNVAATSVTFVSATQLRVQVPATAAGSYIMYVSNPDGATGIRLNAITFSADPQWVTDSTLASQSVDSAISVQLSATDATSYSLQAGSSLPANTTLASNGLFSGTITGINEDTVYNFTVVATDAENQDSPRAFSVTVTVGDTYFKETVLLLNADANTFIRDASNNSFNITPSGDVRPSAFSPYNTNWSNFFDGTSGQYLNAPANTAFNLGTGDFTVEAWIFPTSTSGTRPIIEIRTAAVNSTGFAFLSQSGAQTLNVYTNNGFVGASTNTYNLNQWNHVALTRSGNTWTYWINGVSGGSFTNSSTQSDGGTTGPKIAGSTTTGEIWRGYISNARITKGNRLIDNSTNAFTITKNGDVKVSAFGPFTETDTTTGSGYFDGTGDFLDPATSNSAFSFDTGNFTVEAWIYPNSLSNYMGIVGQAITSADTQHSFFVFANGQVTHQSYFAVGLATTTSNITTGMWHHVAAVRSGANGAIFINGVRAASNTAYTKNYSNTNPIRIGAAAEAGSAVFNGYISNARVIKGTAVYDPTQSTITVPTTSLTAVANTQLLTLQNRIGYNNHQFVDSTGVGHIITRNGNASQGSFSPYVPTGWSGYFDGSGDFLSLTGTSATNFNGVDWTVECWFYKTALSGGNEHIIQSTTGTNNWVPYLGLGLNNNLTVFASINATQISSSQSYSLNTWNHLAMVRSGGVVKVYLNGTATSISVTSDITSTNLSFWFGKVDNTPGGGSYIYHFNGYLSNLRMVKGTAVYTSNFTPPTSPLPPIANTQLLMLRTGSFVDESANRFAITRSGDVRVVPFSPFKSHTITANSHSVYFDGTGDYLTMADDAVFALGTNNFTIEAWVLPQNSAANSFWFNQWETSAASDTNSSFVLSITSGKFQGAVTYGGSTSQVTLPGSSSVLDNQWYHVALVRNGSSLTLYVNGQSENTSPTLGGSSVNNSNLTLFIGSRRDGTRTFQGYVSNARLVNGTALYTSNFTPSTTPLTAIANTQLLTCQSTSIIDNSTNAFTLTAVGNATASKFNPFGETITQVVEYSPNTHGGSVYLDGNDYLEYSNNTTINDMRVGTSNWTVEGWIYPTSSLRATNLATEQSLTSSVTHTINQWIHVAMARANTTTVRLFTNGILSNTLTISATASINDTALQNYTLGCSTNPVTNYFTGYMSDWRYIKGQCLYTTSFVPPLQSHQSIQGTHVLQKFTAGTIVDRSGREVNETVGNASTSSAVKKFGTGSLYFDGTGDYLMMPRADPNVAFGTGNFTIEFWLYFSGTPSVFYALFDTRPASTQGAYTFLYLNNDRTLRFWVSSADRITSSVLSANTWYHVAVCRSSSSTKMFIDGTQTGSTYNDTNNYIASRILIGSSFSGGSSITNSLNGYLDDFRITKGVARYTSNFTAPSALQTK